MVTKHLKATEVAEYFIKKAQEQKGSGKMTPKKLQKIIYYAQAWHLVLKNRRLFEERIEAWLHGPAVTSVYRKYRPFGFSEITQVVSDADLKNISSTTKKFLDQVWGVYGKFDADYLEILSHNEDPWVEARAGVSEFSPSNNEIAPASMKKFYKLLLEKSKESNGKKD